MRTALIGHRGTGKSSLLKRIRNYAVDLGLEILALDLDQEITARTGRSVQEIFSTDGESRFREIEREVFATLDRETSVNSAANSADVFLALGAGFDSRAIPSAWKALWIRRASDHSGRIFTDRPRLNANVNAINEYFERFPAREAIYRTRADQTLWLDEGLDRPDRAECDVIFDQVRDCGGAITVLPEMLSKRDWIERYLKWGIAYFELRDDLLSASEMIELSDVVPPENLLLSFRDPRRVATTRELVETRKLSFDWPQEMGKCPLSISPKILSVHRREYFDESYSGDMILKAALPVSDFAELLEGHRWRMQDPERRVFLPMSSDGRWSWYREWMGPEEALTFLREGDGSSPDQPTLLRWLRRRNLNGESFAAVLGDPVSHSRTPLEQFEFFSERNAPVFAIRASRDEWPMALPVLKELGLRWLAVTAPLKELAFELCEGQVSETASRLRSVNTLIFSEGRWCGENTDLAGFKRAWSESPTAKSKPIAIWGGGGTLALLKEVLPQARLFSARSGEARDRNLASDFSPATLIWAAGSGPSSDLPLHWKPESVFDLSYTDDSPARVYAQKIGARYISGLEMFREQARMQREFWCRTEI